MGGCLGKGGPPDTNDTGPAQIIARLHPIARLSEVIREGNCVIVKCIGVQVLNRLPGALVQKLAALYQYRVVCDLPGERVLKGVLDVARAGPLVNELGEL